MAKTVVNKELAVLVAGMTDPMEIAAVVSSWHSRQIRKRNIAAERRSFVESILNNGKKLSMQQMDGLVWEFVMTCDCEWTFSSWLHNTYPELFMVAAVNGTKDESLQNNNDSR